MHRIVTGLVCLGSLLTAAPPVPRPAKDFRCTEADGKTISLSSYRGKVVLIQFLDTTCPHCQAMSRMLTGLQAEYGPKGFQALGVAFNEATSEMVRGYVNTNHVGFPVGFAPRDTVLAYLGISVLQRLTVPQVMVIDRSGQVRAQTEPLNEPDDLLQEANLRKLIGELLK
jgi:peroxiredoxin